MLFDDQRVDLARITPAGPTPCAAARFVFQSYNLFASKTALQKT